MNVRNVDAARIADKYISRDGTAVPPVVPAKPAPATPAPPPVADPAPADPAPAPPGEDGESPEGDGGVTLLKNLVERIQRLDKVRMEYVEDIKVVYGEAEARGFDKKILRRIIAALKQDEGKRLADQDLFDVYMDAVKGAGGAAPAAVAPVPDQDVGIYDDMQAIAAQLNRLRIQKGVSPPYTAQLSSAQWQQLQTSFANKFPGLYGSTPVTLEQAAKKFGFQAIKVK